MRLFLAWITRLIYIDKAVSLGNSTLPALSPLKTVAQSFWHDFDDL